MLYRNEAAAIAQQWQAQIDESLEAGEALWFELGVSNRVFDTIRALTALQRLAAYRADVTTPGLFVGGDGVVWLTICMSSAVAPLANSAPGITPLYGGADQATYMAALATLPGPATYTRQRFMTGLPAGLYSWLQPTSQPGVVPSWTTLPFVMARQVQATDRDGEAVSGDAWLSWLTLIVVIGLVVTALFV